MTGAEFPPVNFGISTCEFRFDPHAFDRDFRHIDDGV
jgi:hypothetical protein